MKLRYIQLLLLYHYLRMNKFRAKVVRKIDKGHSHLFLIQDDFEYISNYKRFKENQRKILALGKLEERYSNT